MGIPTEGYSASPEGYIMSQERYIMSQKGCRAGSDRMEVYRGRWTPKMLSDGRGAEGNASLMAYCHILEGSHRDIWGQS